MSKIVLVSDIHGNYLSLKNAVEQEGKNAEYVILGDIHGLGGFPAEVMDLINEMNTTVVLAGNHDRAIFGKDEGHVVSDSLSEYELNHTKANLTPAQQSWVHNLPHFETEQRDGHDILYTHAKPWPEEASGYAHGNTGIPKGHVTHFAAQVGDDNDYVFHGHTHEQYSLDCSRFGHDVHFVNPGTLGYDGCYATVDTATGEVSLKNVEFDIETVFERINDTLPDGAPRAEEWF